MPIIKSAKKKMKQDKKRTTANSLFEKKYKEAIRMVKKSTSKKDQDNLVKKAYQAIDKAEKKGIIHKNKAARLKSQVTKHALKK